MFIVVDGYVRKLYMVFICNTLSLIIFWTNLMLMHFFVKINVAKINFVTIINMLMLMYFIRYIPLCSF